MYNGKVVIVTGAARGIGRALAKAYHEKGATVIAADLLETTFEEEMIVNYQVDLGNAQAIDEMFAYVLREFGRAHILINNGAIAQFNKNIFKLTNEEFQNVINVNLNGAFACSKAFIQSNSGECYGRIVNIASTRWYQNEAGWEAYGASKGGLVSLTHTMAVSLAETPITVNAISPGWIQVEEYELLTELDHAQHPSNRVGRAEDIVKAALYLTDVENDFVNGHNLVVDGGMTKKMIYV